MSQQQDLSTSTADVSLTIRKLVHTSPQRVFDAFTQPELLRR